MDPSSINRVQQLYLYLLNVANKLGYRRKNGIMYRVMFVKDGADAAAENPQQKHDSHSLTQECTLSEFVRINTRKETNYDMWCNVTH